MMTNTSDKKRVYAEEVLPYLENVSRSGEGWVASCPVPGHDDSNPSFSIRDGDEDIIFTCHGGCERAEIHKALRDMGAIPPLEKKKPGRKKLSEQELKQVAEYIYTNESGEPVMRVLRFEPKTFRQQAWDGKKWQSSLKDVEQFYPYRVQEFHDTKRVKPEDGTDRAILIFEGEKDADLACELGVLGTTFPMGAGKWKDEYAQWFAGRKVYIVPDGDTAGMNHAQMIASKLYPITLDNEIKIVEIPNSDEQKKGFDFSDYIDGGGDIRTFAKMCSDAPKWKPESRLKPRAEDKPKSSVAHVDFKNKNPVTHEPYIPSDREEHWKLMSKTLVRNNDGAIEKTSITNAEIFLENHPDTIGTLGYNKRTNCAYMISPFKWDSNIDGDFRPLRDTDKIGATVWLEKNGIKCNSGVVVDLINKIAERYPFDYLTDWLNGLQWDGTERINTLLSDYFGAERTALNSLISTKFMVGAAARALQPGCQMDDMLILEGRQGIKKSTGLEALFSREYFCDQLPSLSKAADAAMQLAGHWGIEVQEMHTMSKAESNRIKEFLSIKVDKYRPPFGRHPIKVPRCCVFVGTINPEGGYLKDPTGARRFWPVYVRDVNVNAIERDRAQLWAEAVKKFRDGVHWWFDKDRDDAEMTGKMVEEQRRRFDADIWTETILEWVLEHRHERITVVTVATQCLGFDVDKLNPQVQSRVAKTLQAIGCKPARSGNTRYYRPPGELI